MPDSDNLECPGCGNWTTVALCPYCGTRLKSEPAPLPESYGATEVPPPHRAVPPAPPSGKRVPAAVLAFFFGSFGGPKFYLGQTGAGLVRLGAMMFTFGLAYWVLAPIAFIETLIYALKSDEDFDRTYVASKKSWF